MNENLESMEMALIEIRSVSAFRLVRVKILQNAHVLRIPVFKLLITLSIGRHNLSTARERITCRECSHV